MKVHFIGIGGTGMGALAGLLAAAGHEVRGSDEDIYPPMSTQLAAAGIPWVRGFRAENLSWGPETVVVGNVCGKDHVEVQAARDLGLPLESFPQLLARLLLADRKSLVVAGTHGKTTTASAVAWLLCEARLDPTFFIGGVPVNLGRGYRLGHGPYFVIEGDEYDTAFFDKGSKFLHYRPTRAILTNVEFDHADIFPDLEAVRAAFRAFVATLDPGGELLVNQGDAEAMGIAADAPCPVVTYRVLAERSSDVNTADYCATVIARGGARRTVFEIFEDGVSLGEFSTPLLARYNVANLLAAVALARRLGLEVESLRAAVRAFRGVRRRQELVGVAQGVRVLEDFAHHPTACALTTTAVRRRYPDKAVHVCFEPRSASSRRQRFLTAYASSFDAATEVHVGPLFRPEKIPEGERLDPSALVSAIRERGVSAHAYATVEALLDAVVERVVPGDTILVLSSGSFGGLPRRLLTALGDPVMLGEPEDAEAVDALLASYGLPRVVRSGRVETLVVRTAEAGIAGAVSLEAGDQSALLFGLAVNSQRRGEGLGWVLGDSVLRHARTLGVSTVYLFTSSAADFFATKLGFRQLDGVAVDPEVRRMDNFTTSAALDNAVCMVLELPPEGAAISGSAEIA